MEVPQQEGCVGRCTFYGAVSPKKTGEILTERGSMACGLKLGILATEHAWRGRDGLIVGAAGGKESVGLGQK